MDPFSFLILLLMATFTLSSAGLLVGFVVMERNPGRWTPTVVPAKGRRGARKRNAKRVAL